MNSIYAPGPWTVKGTSIQSFDHGKRYTMARVANSKFSPEGIAGTAKLMAAAPDMLEALEELFKHCVMMHKYGGTACNSKEANIAQALAHAAIAKATGEAS